MAKFKNKVIKYSMQSVLSITAFVARRESLLRLNNASLGRLAKLKARRLKKDVSNVGELGLTWQKAFPSSKQVPITDITDDTVYAEIQTPCPHRGSGDLLACYRMMEYDRAFVREFGGEFIVLNSQAEPGRKTCIVAMRLAGDPSENLEHAHIRVAREQGKSIPIIDVDD